MSEITVKLSQHEVGTLGQVAETRARIGARTIARTQGRYVTDAPARVVEHSTSVDFIFESEPVRAGSPTLREDVLFGMRTLPPSQTHPINSIPPQIQKTGEARALRILRTASTITDARAMIDILRSRNQHDCVPLLERIVAEFAELEAALEAAEAK